MIVIAANGCLLVACSAATPPSGSPSQRTSAKAACVELRSQLRTKLPAQLVNKMSIRRYKMKDPMQPSRTVVACQIRMKSNGARLQNFGLNSAFMERTLGQMGWSTSANLQGFSADSPTHHQMMLSKAGEVALLKYEFAPPARLHCPNNQPIASCGSQQVWEYKLALSLFFR